MDHTTISTKEDIIVSLFRTYAQDVLAVAYYVVRDPGLAEDIMQDTFLTAMNRLHQLRDGEKVGGWLKRIAINRAYNELRKRKNWALINYPAVSPDNIIEESLIAKEQAEHLYAALDRLPKEYQLVLVLKYHSRLTVKEISQVLDAPEATIKSRLQRSKDLFYRYYRMKARVNP
ncbi:MAG: RNA polymerase sigma factor [Bacillota bacterium]|uniref:RNA polymerase sigma factor n=1 Tax=unclassified Candidatus Desulforudis TaxID=2635950 RepID=UPI003BD0597B